MLLVFLMPQDYSQTLYIIILTRVLRRVFRIMQQGTVKWFNAKKGYGFISDAEGNDVFVHYSGLNMEGYKNLEENQKVEFDVVDGEKQWI